MIGRFSSRLHKREGFTLTELLIVVALLGLLFIAAIWNWRFQIARGQDATRKSDLYKIKMAFEDYYNDHDCYPPITILSSCGSTTDFAPYLVPVPCDPVTRLPYRYVPIDDANLCAGYRVLTTLSDTSDPAITGLGCDPFTGCGFGALYNWGISQGASVVIAGFNPSDPPPIVPGGSGSWACDPNGICNNYANPGAAGCPWTFPTSECGGQCGDPDNWCRD